MTMEEIVCLVSFEPLRSLIKHSGDLARKKRKSENSDRRSVVALGAKTPVRYVETSWEAVDWSCAYDAVVVPLSHTLRTHPVAFASAVQHMSRYMTHLLSTSVSCSITTDRRFTTPPE